MHSHELLEVPLGTRVSQPAVRRQAPGLGAGSEQARQVSTPTAQLAPERLVSDLLGYFCQLPTGTCQEHLPATEQQQGRLPSASAEIQLCTTVVADLHSGWSEALCAPGKLV